MAQDLVLAVCKLALYDTCSSGILVVKEIRACACRPPKGNSKIADTCTATQVDLSLSVGLWVGAYSNCRKLCANFYIKYPSPFLRYTMLSD